MSARVSVMLHMQSYLLMREIGIFFFNQRKEKALCFGDATLFD